MNIGSLQRISANNQDVCNEKLSAKQDCSDIINIAIFFDGTGNNYKADTAEKKWANPARLWRNAILYKEEHKKTSKANYAIYVAGVGTKFNGELNFFEKVVAWFQDNDFTGGGTGVGGARRLEYGEYQVNNALKEALIHHATKLEKEVDKYIQEKQASSFAELNASLKEHQLIKKINISLFGFSRGAALARAFSNQLISQCELTCDGLKYTDVPIEFKFLGLFDTVASFGLPATNLNNNISFKGRDLVIDERVEKCVHFIAGNEQRFAFPVDLISSNNELKKDKWLEEVYPGMHSDVGGGYTPAQKEIEASNNFARIPLKRMLDEALAVGVKMYSYDELKEKHLDDFNEYFKIEEETQRLYDAVNAERVTSGTIKDQVKASMQQFYSAYGTLHRQGIETPNQIERRDIKSSWFEKLIPWGPANMATEMERFTKLQNITSNQTGFRKIYKILSPVKSIYQWYVSIDDWEFESWHKDTNSDISEFYRKYIHDSKYGFLANMEPFSYFRQRTIYESKRSKQGEMNDQHLEAVNVSCTVANVVTQDEFEEYFEQAQNEELEGLLN